MTLYTPQRICDTLEYVMMLKDIPRTGWVDRHIPDPESVADHTLGVVFYTRALAMEARVDVLSHIEMAMVHDLVEALVGDINWQPFGVPDYEKKKAKDMHEREAMNVVFPEEDTLRTLALEYMDQKTDRAKLVKEADKLEMLDQAVMYEPRVSDIELLRDFWKNVAGALKSDPAKELYRELKSRSTLTGLPDV